MLTNVSGHITENTLWDNTSEPYQLVGNLFVDNGATLTLAPGVELRSDLGGYDIYVDGRLEGTDALVGLQGYHYKNNYSDLYVRSGGELWLSGGTVVGNGTNRRMYVYDGGTADLLGVTFSGHPLVQYQSGSSGTVEYCVLQDLSMHSGANVWIANNDLSDSSISVNGDASSTVYIENNWWGTTDPVAIEANVQHHPDNPNLPWADYAPWLTDEPSRFRSFYVTGRVPEAYLNQTTECIDIVFNKLVDPAEFAVSDVSLVGPNEAVEVPSIEHLARTTWRVHFAPLIDAGTYTLTVGPDVLDVGGDAMDQDLDGTFGEAEDAYVVNFMCDLTAPFAISHVPGGDIAGTVSYLDVTFSDTMDPASFTTADVQITGPGGASIAPSSVSKITDTRYRISFAGQTSYGEHLLRIGPGITDDAGNYLDQNRNGTGGEPADFYEARFNLVDVDLELSNVVVAATQLWVGESVNISWDGANNTGLELLGDWTDAIYLSADDQWDIGDILLATVDHTGGLAPDTTYSQSVDVIIPGVFPREYHLVLRADLFNQAKEGGDEGNNVLVVDALPVNVRALTNDAVPVSGTLTQDDRADYYVIEAGPRESIWLNLDGHATSGANELYAAHGRIPTRYDFDHRALTRDPDVEFAIPGVYDGGTYYLLVYADQISGNETYGITGEAFEIKLTEVTPDQYGNQMPATVTLSGVGFDDRTTVEFVASDGAVLVPASQIVIDSTEITAELDLPNWLSDTYDVRVTKSTGGTSTLSDAFTVVPGLGPQLQTNLLVPSSVRQRTPITAWIEYRNTGDAPMPAPMFVISANGNAYLSTDESIRRPTSWPPEDATDKVLLWAIGSAGTPGTLLPGDSGRLPVYGVAIDGIQWSLATLTTDSTDTIDWASMKDPARLEWISPQAWDAAWEAFTAQVGDTWGDFVEYRARIVDHLHSLGQDVTTLTMDEILAYAVTRATDASPNPYLTAVVDSQSPAPGISLTFRRVFTDTVASRNRNGVLGYGWSHNWEYSVEALNGGNVVVRGPGGADRFFLLDGSTYTALAGDRGVLSHDGTAFLVTEIDGTTYQFNADATLTYVQDRYGNRVTCGYTGSRLTSLTHTNGDQILIDYNLNGHISQVTDPMGAGTDDDRVTTFEYGAAGHHLEKVTAPGNRVTNYAYQTAGTLAELHGLLSITHPDSATQEFGFDQYGRLTSTSHNGGQEAVVFAYDAAGNITVTDANGIQMVIGPGLDGQAGRMETPGSGGVVRASYDGAGQILQIVGPEGQLSRLGYDEAGNVTEIIDPRRTTTSFTYETAYDQLDTLTDANGHVTDFDYFANGSPKSITYEDGTSESFTYYANGLVQTWTNRRGQSVSYSYTVRGQVETKDYETTVGVDYSYTYDLAGNLKTATDPYGTTAFDYYSDTHWLRRIDYPAGQWFEFTYDEFGRRKIRTDQDGNVVNYSYVNSKLDILTDGTGETIVDYDYFANGRLQHQALGNGVYTTYDYDGAGWLIHLVNCDPSGTAISRFDYTYDASGRRATMTTLDGTFTYGYDSLGQLTSVEYPDSHILSYEYDAVGNRLQVDDDGAVTTYIVNEMNQYDQVGAVAYTYDDDGNLASKDEGGITNTYDYDAENRLVRVTTPTDTWEYHYDALGDRVATIHSGSTTDYIIDPSGYGNVAGEYDDSGSLIATYQHGHGLLARMNTAGDSAFYTFDAVGNTSE